MGMSQGLPLRFSAQYDNGSYHPFDTVKIENLTRGWTTFLVYPDTSIVISPSSTDGIDVATRSGKSGIKVYPNPFAGKTETVFQMAESGEVIIRIIRIDGSVATEYHGHLASGGYRIGVSMSKPQVAFLCIETGGQRHVAKLVNCSDGGSDRIAIIGQVATSTRQTKDTDLDFEPGDMMRYMAVSMLGEHRTESEPMTQELVEGGDIILLFTDGDHPNDGAFDENGASYATFSVAADRQVRFSKGNLQYRASTNTWRFAEHQYDCIDSGNTNISETYNGWIDLFGWGTSGWNSGAIAYQPWSTSENNEDYTPGDNTNNNLTDDYENADWGVYNAILNGGNEPGMWRTLTSGELRYLFESRPDADLRNGCATVNGMPGLVILPDNWLLPTGLTFTSNISTGFESNVYTAEQWVEMENAGALFLPAAGYRSGSELQTSPEWSPINGVYWTSTHDNDYQQVPGAYVLWITTGGAHYIGVHGARHMGISVRLVMDYVPAEPSIRTKEVTEVNNDFAISGGIIVYNGGEDVTERGVCWSTSHNPTTEDSHTHNGAGIGTFTSHISGLSPSTTYYVRAYATNSIGTAYGNEVEFTTEDVLVPTTPTVVTSDANNITTTSASCGGNVVYSAGEAVIARGVCWSTNHTPTVDDNHTSDGNGIGEFSSIINGLTPATTYYVRAYATNSIGTAYGEEIAFATANNNPTPGFDGNGASYALFSVASGKLVNFSSGNLQYQASTNTWRFAEHQYDFIGTDNANITSLYSGWIDLFGWGTSGWNGTGGTSYQPWQSATSGYGPQCTNYDGVTYNLTDELANADWGVYNTISYGANQTDMWRTLSSDEWNYLLFSREASTVSGTPNARYAKALIDTIKGLIILPDNFTMPSNLAALTNINVNGAAYNSNTYTTEEWAQMESAGALFLPLAGERYETATNYIGRYGEYWTSSYHSDCKAESVIISNSNLYISSQTRALGLSVRLVRDKDYADDSTATLATIETTEVTEIGSTYAKFTNNAIDDGGSFIISKGVCWSTLHNPTIEDNHIYCGNDLGEFVCTINELNTATTYYARAYVTNSVGTAYGNEVEFTTGEDSTIMEAFDENGASYSLFSVSDTQQVRFSRGNLQFQASTGIWRFAGRQYDFVGSDNSNISSTYSGWIDLFGWGTSGWNSGVTCYQPWSTGATDNDFITHNFTGDYANADWGVYNPISNGGNQAGMWRTLTSEEWNYLLFTRSASTVNGTANARFTKALVDNTKGLIVLPDNFIMPSDLTAPTNINITEAAYNVNTYTVDEWTLLQSAGALFLPISGERSIATVNFVGTYGEYWSSTYKNNSQNLAVSVLISNSNLTLLSQETNYGFSVRLVRDNNDINDSVATLPTVETIEVSEIGITYATVSSNVIDDGGSDITSKGVCWSTSHNPNIDSNHTVDGSRLGEFTSTISDLTPGTTYYVRAYATNSVGTAYGAEISFTTDSLHLELPSVSTSSNGHIEVSYAIFGGEVTGDGNTPVTSRGVCWSTDNNPTISDSHTIDSNGIGGFTSCLTGLTGGTTYHIRAYASNALGTSYGEEITFTTEVQLASGFDENGASIALFSVSDTSKVKFSRGNLRYQASSNTWSFAENQYYYIGSNNINISPNYSGWIDLFGWGTSGWNSGANAYQPWSSSTTPSDYISNIDLNGEYSNADWGVYNAISNGGNQTGLWRTLTYDEWNYLLFSRDDVLRYAKATVNGIYGLIIFPDNFTMPSGLSVNRANNTETRFYVNTYSLEQWNTLQSANCIFLPAAGVRNGTSGVTYPGTTGRYWSSSWRDYGNPWYMYIYDNSLGLGNFLVYYGQSVRLVRDFQYADDSTASLSTVLTLEASEIESSYAIVSGNVTDEGGSEVTSRGVCWSTAHNPTIDDSHTIAGEGMGEFSCILSILTPNTTYYARAYAINSVGTAYGTEITINSPGINPGFDENGATIALFSVAEDRQIHFSKGNLQYQASSNTWRFAENQYDHMGDGNSNCSSYYNGWIDLFSWGTSGWHSEPWSSNGDHNDYSSGEESINNLTGDCVNADWGVYNSILNGGNQTGMWRTLNYDEWNYLLNSRAGTRFTKAKVNGVNGMIIFPDNFTLPTGLVLNNINTMYSPAGSDNIYTVDEWAQLESIGAIFLPAAGWRGYGDVGDVGTFGYYWTSSYISDEGAYYVFFYNGLDLDLINRATGYSVRLVKD